MQNKNNTEKTLIAQLQNAKTQDLAFRHLMGLYKECLYWHIRRIVLHHEDAADVLQNTFIKVYRNIGGFKADAKLYTWLYRIASNEAYTFLQQASKKKHQSLDDYQFEAAESLADDVYFDGDEIQQKLYKALATLPQKQQEVFRLKYFDAMKYKDIAVLLDKSVGGLKASYHLAVKKIELYLTSN